MAVLPLSENDNKENIPPFFYSEQRAILTAKSPLFPYNKRRVRKPLEDITNLFNQPIPSISVPQNRIPIDTSFSLACKVKYGKRRSVEGVNSMYKNTPLVSLSKNFR